MSSRISGLAGAMLDLDKNTKVITLTKSLKIAVAGARGKMGQATIEYVSKVPELVFVGSIARNDKGNFDNYEIVLDKADIIIDFSRADSSAILAEICASRGAPPMVIGSTGFGPDSAGRVAAAASKIAIVRSGNFSVGANILTGLVALTANTLPAEAWDIEIFEAHHRQKVDAPSGTALMLADAAAKGRQMRLSDVERHNRRGFIGPRKVGDIGFAVIRGGTIFGEHSVIYASNDEIITLSHSALSRDVFVHGAILAAEWVAGRSPGEYDMQDVLRLRTNTSTTTLED